MPFALTASHITLPAARPTDQRSTLAAFIGWPLRIAWTLILVGVFYLVGMNVLLSLPQTPQWISDTLPGETRIEWKKAWTLWPVNLHMTDVQISGRSGNRRWTFNSSEIGAGVDLMALRDRQIVISDAHIVSPRIGIAATADAAVSTPSREPSGGTKPDRATWTLFLDQAWIAGDIRFTSPELVSELDGRLAASAQFDSGTRMLEIADGVLDAKIGKLAISGERDLIRSGEASGTFELSPVPIGPKSGAAILDQLNATLKLATDSDDLRILNPWLSRFRNLTVSGTGVVTGDLALAAGRLQPGSGLTVAAPVLEMSVLGFGVSGDGAINLGVDPATPELLDAEVLFNEVAGYAANGETPLIQGEQLSVQASASSALRVDAEALKQNGRIGIALGKVSVDDIAAFQAYLPSTLPLRLNGGKGSLTASLELDPEHLESRIVLSADQASISLDQVDVQTGLDIVVAVGVDSFNAAAIDLNGTSIKLSDTRIDKSAAETVAGEDVEPETPRDFSTTLTIERGLLTLDNGRFADGAKRWAEMVKSRQIDPLLENASADLKIVGEVSGLNWINALIRNPYDLRVDGRGALEARLLLEQGKLSSGSQLKVGAPGLDVGFLDYLVSGKGDIDLALQGKPDSLDLGLDVTIQDGTLKRQDQSVAYVEVPEIRLTANASAVTPDREAENMALSLKMPEARLSDMTIYNAYLPETSPLKIESGAAQLAVDLALEPDSATGSVLLTSRDLGVAIDEQQIEAALNASIHIAGGQPAQMQFDISGSAITIDQVQVVGETDAFDGKDGAARKPWHVTLDLDRGIADWKKPLQIDADARLTMLDTRPLVAVLANTRGKQGWIEEQLTIDNVTGKGTLAIRNERITVPYLMVDAGDIQIGAKAAFEGIKRAGVVYARYKKLNGLLKFSGSQRNFDILKARQQFDEYDVAKVELKAADPAKKKSKKPGKSGNDVTPKGDARSDEDGAPEPKPGRKNYNQSSDQTAIGNEGSSGIPDGKKKKQRSKQWQPFEGNR